MCKSIQFPIRFLITSNILGSYKQVQLSLNTGVYNKIKLIKVRSLTVTHRLYLLSFEIVYWYIRLENVIAISVHWYIGNREVLGLNPCLSVTY